MLRFARKPTREERATAEAERLVSAYADLIGRLARVYLRSTADADDIVQEVLVKLLVAPPAFESAEHERAWVIATARNACLDLLKSARWRTTVALDESFDEPAALPEPEELASASSVLEAVDRLPRAYREAIHLYYYEELSIGKIAELTGESTSAVAKRLSRARAMLKDKLGGSDE